MKKSIFLAAAVALTMFSCSNENQDNAGATPDGAIRFTTSALSIQSRGAVEGTTFPAGSEIGIFSVPSNAGVPQWATIYAPMNDVKGTVAGDGAVDYSPNVYYYPGATKLNFYAYYPYSATATANASAAPTIAIAPGGLTDYMYAVATNGTSGYGKDNNPVALNFNHAMSLVNVKIQKGQNVSDNITLTGLSLTTSSPQEGTMNIATGDITDDLTGTGNTYLAESLSVLVPAQGGTGNPPTNTDISAATAAYSFLFIPGSTLTGISLTISGETYNGAIAPSFLTLVKGAATNLVITVNATEITFTADVTDWTDGGTENLIPN